MTFSTLKRKSVHVYTSIMAVQASTACPGSRSGKLSRNMTVFTINRNRTGGCFYLVTSFFWLKAFLYWEGVMPSCRRKMRIKYFSSVNPQMEAMRFTL